MAGTIELFRDPIVLTGDWITYGQLSALGSVQALCFHSATLFSWPWP